MPTPQSLMSTTELIFVSIKLFPIAIPIIAGHDILQKMSCLNFNFLNVALLVDVKYQNNGIFMDLFPTLPMMFSIDILPMMFSIDILLRKLPRLLERAPCLLMLIHQ